MEQLVRDRVEKLVALLLIDEKPSKFRIPTCLGFFEDTKKTVDRFGFVYEIPVDKGPAATPTSLFQLLSNVNKPSLTDRFSISRAVADCLLYLHSVNWLHKGFKSDNIIFFKGDDKAVDYESLVVTGSEYARPDVQGAATEAVRQRTPYDIYRHPGSLNDPNAGSRKSYDIYSLGIMLIEIACWMSIDKVLDIPLDQIDGISELVEVRERLLSKSTLDMVGAHAGDRYREVLRKCLKGGSDLGIAPNAIESDPAVGAAIQSAFSEQIVRQLSGLRT